jgi:hypothetical protein
MPTYSLPNTQTGGSQSVDASSLAAAESQAQSGGTWSPAAGTYGAKSSPGGDTSGGSQGGNQGGGNAADTAALTAAFNAAGTMSQKQLDQQKAEFDAQLAFQQQQMQQEGIPQVVINQQLAVLQQQEFAFQSNQAVQQQALAQAQVTGQYSQPFQPSTPDQFAQQSNSVQQQYINAHGKDNPQLSAAANAANAWAADASQAGLAAYNANGGGTPQQTLAAQLQAANIAAQNAGLTGIFQGSPTLAAQQQAFGQGVTAAGLTGSYQGQQTQQAQLQAFNEALQQQQLGLGALQTAATLTGPSNFVQAANYARGIQNTQVPQFLNNLLSGQNGTIATGGSGLSTPLSIGTLASNLGATPGNPNGVSGMNGGTGNGTAATNATGASPQYSNMYWNPNAPGAVPPGTQAPVQQMALLGSPTSAPSGATSQPDMNQTLSQASKVAQAGGSALGPQAWESLSPDEQSMFGSMVGGVGGSMPTFLQQYKQSRIGQGAAQAA